jgi:hypothetical protein
VRDHGLTVMLVTTPKRQLRGVLPAAWLRGPLNASAHKGRTG